MATPARRLALRTPLAFADALAGHVNYLSRPLKAAKRLAALAAQQAIAFSTELDS